MEESPLYVGLGESSKVCLIAQAIYELKSPRGWFAKFSGLLFTFGFTSCVVNPTMLTKKTKGNFVILAIYVDHVSLIGSDDTSIQGTKAYL